MVESFPKGRKHCWKRRNCSLRAISPFPAVFSRLVLQTHKNQSMFGKGLTFELISAGKGTCVDSVDQDYTTQNVQSHL